MITRHFLAHPPNTPWPSTQAIEHAQRLWTELLDHHKELAIALAHYLQEDPPSAVPACPTWITHTDNTPPEIAPYSIDGEDCGACLEAEDGPCRYHRGRWDS